MLILFIFAGCSNRDVIKHNYTYIGENELWSAEYKVNGVFDKTSYESTSDAILTVTYKRNLSELSTVKQLKISSISSFRILTVDHLFDGNPPNEKTYTANISGEGIENKDEIVKVNITLDGKKQIIELRNAQ
jgi:hypothetical protein